jgi:DNA-binding transcriptional ArsR family regulator
MRTEQRDAITNRLKAMVHPLRRRILLYLQEHGVQSPSQIARGLRERGLHEATTDDVSHHMKQLVKLGCAELVEERKVGPSVAHFYRHTDRHLIDDSEWEELDDWLIKEGLLADFMQPAVDDFTNGVRAQTFGHDARWHLTRDPIMGVDEEGLDEMLAIHRRAFFEVREVQERCADRMKKTGQAPISVSSFQGCFKVPHF